MAALGAEGFLQQPLQMLDRAAGGSGSLHCCLPCMAQRHCLGRAPSSIKQELGKAKASKRPLGMVPRGAVPGAGALRILKHKGK